MSRIRGLFFLTVLMIGLSVHAEEISGIGGDFVLQSADGDVALQDFRGKVVLLYFGYTNCPDACPTTLQQWKRAFKKLSPEERERVRGFMVSVDPERDSPKRLKVFVSFFHDNILGLTGSHEDLRKVTAQYGTSYKIEEHEPGKGYGVDHSFYVFIIGPDGKTRHRVDFTLPAEDLVDIIRSQLRS